MSRLDNRAYYDDFAGWYERERHLPYHRMLDDLEVEIVERYARGKETLEVGCGTGLILDRGCMAATATDGLFAVKIGRPLGETTLVMVEF